MSRKLFSVFNISYLLVVLSIMLLLTSRVVDASHFRGGGVSWTAVDIDGDDGSGNLNDVEITVKTAWRWDFLEDVNTTNVVSVPALTLTETSEVDIFIGPAGQDYAIRTTVFQATNLNINTQYIVNFFGSARIAGLENNASGDWDIQTQILMEGDNLSPRFDLPIIFEIPQLQSDEVTPFTDYTFQLVATEPNSDSMQYRLANLTELGGGSSTNATGLSIDANTGLITWSGSGTTPGTDLSPGLYSAGIVVEDVDSLGAVKSKSHFDFILDLQNLAAIGFTSTATGNVLVEKGSFHNFTISNNVDAISSESLGDVQGALTEPTDNNFTFTPGTVGSGLDPGQYPITFEVSEDAGGSTKSYLVLNFIVPDPDAPKIANIDGDTTTYTGSDDHLIDDSLDSVLTDTADLHLNGGKLKINITFTDGEFENLGVKSVGTGLGEISVSGSNVLYEGDIIGVIDNGENGEGQALLIDFTTNDSTIAAVQALIRSITYTDTFVLRASGERAISIFIEDPSGKNNSYNLTVDVQDHPDKPPTSAPYLLSNSLTLSDGETITLTTSDLRYVDADDADIDIDITVSSITNGHFELISTGSTVTTFTQADINAGDVIFIHDNNNTPPTYSVSADDGTNVTAVTPAIISFTGATSTSLSVDENETEVADVPSTAVVGTPTFTKNGGADTLLFSVDSGSGALTFDAGPDYETPGDAGSNNVYDVIINVVGSTSGNVDITYSISVQDENEFVPNITSNGGAATASINFDENSTADVTSVSASDSDGTSNLIYSLSGGTDELDFTIDSVSGDLSFNVTPDFESAHDSDTNNDYVVEVQVTDGSNVVTQIITVDVQNLDEIAPRIVSIVRQTPSSSPTNADSVTWRVTFDEDVNNITAADFAVSGTTATVTGFATQTADTVFDVTASGGDLAGLNATATLGFDGAQDIDDDSGNLLSNLTPTGTNNNTYVIDNSSPTVGISAIPAANDTNKAAYPVSGTCTAGDGNVTVTITGITAQTPACSGGGAWGPLSFDVTGLSDGATAITVNASQTDSAGNAGNASQLQAAKDVVLPTVVISAIPAANDTNKGVYPVSGTCTAGDGNVTVTVTGITAQTPACSGGGAWGPLSFDVSGLGDGATAITVNASQTDSAGNAGSATQLQAAKDVVLPTVVISAIPAANDTNKAAYPVSGTCTAGDGNVTVTITGITAQTPACSGGGAWGPLSFDVSGLGDGATAITVNANQTDSGGNTGSATQLQTAKDVVLPTVGISAIPAANNTNKAAYPVSGTCTAGDGNVTVTITGITAQTPACSGGGAWGPLSFDVTGLSDGATAITVNASQTDSAGNAGNATQLQTAKDVVLPTVGISAIPAANDTNKAAYPVSGTCTAGDGNVTVTITGITAQTPACSGGGAWGPLSFDVSGLGDGATAITVNANQTDSAGNTGNATQLQAAKDIIVPVVSITAPITATIANESSYPVNGTCTIGDGNLTVTITSVTPSSPACIGGLWSANFDVSGLSDGPSAITVNANQTDTAGNTGNAVQAQAGKDTVAPSAASCTVSPNPANDTTALTATCTGVETGGSVSIPNYTCGAESGNVVVCTGTAGAGQVSGDRTATSFDLVGNPANSNTPFTLDNTPPSAAVCTVSPNPAMTATAITVTCTGVEAGGGVSIVDYTCGAESGGTVICTGTAGTGGGQVGGDKTATAIDFSGNPVNSNVPFVLDDSAPVVVIDALSLADSANELAYPVSGTCTNTDGNVTVTVTGLTVQTPVCSSGIWGPVSFDVSGISDGINIIVVNASQTDAALNKGNASEQQADKLTDNDGDGISNADEGTDDTDGDGILDQDDPDSDNDGIPDVDEGDTDSDGDGVPDYKDPDSDNDGIPDYQEGGDDTDGDGTPDYIDGDSDNDGISDQIENGSSVPTGDDTDGDGLDDAYDVDQTGGEDLVPSPDGNGIDDSEEEPLDTDGDGIPDYKDFDSDDDGVPDAIEAMLGIDGQPRDTDGDGNPDYLDTDADNDGIGDSSEDDVITTDGAGVIDDADGDGIADGYDADADGDDIVDTGKTDLDGDGVDDNTSATDTDGDGLPDYLDLDSDHDSIPDSIESGEVIDEDEDGISDDGTVTTEPVDTDGDGIPDYRDVDSDGDGVYDMPPALAPFDLDGDGSIDTTEPDTDGDGIADVGDADPFGYGTVIDTDGDGIPVAVDVDDDNDGIPDIVEGGPDSDGDGYPDFVVDTDGDGIPDAHLDTDGDGVPNYLDVDSDNDGIVDAIETGGSDDDEDGQLDGDINIDGSVSTSIVEDEDDIIDSDFIDEDGDGVSDSDGVPDYLDLDSDNDGISDVLENGGNDEDADGQQDPDTTLPNLGVLPNGAVAPAGGEGALDSPKDTDGDGTPDYIDVDSDNDGFFDIVESGNSHLDANGDGMIDTAVDLDGDGIKEVLVDLDGDGIIDVVDFTEGGDPVELFDNPYQPEGGFDTSTTAIGIVHLFYLTLIGLVGIRRRV